MRRLPFHLTCLVVGFALCAAPGVDAGGLADTRITLSKQTPERPHLGLPAPHAQGHAIAPQFFVAPNVALAPLLTRTGVMLERPREDADPGIWWRARAHPAQAPPA